MFSIYTKITTPESSPILGPAQSPNQTLEPLDSASNQQHHGLGGGIGLLCACCSRTRGSITITGDDIAQRPDNISNNISIQTNAPLPDILEKCKRETHFTHYNYRVLTPRQMPPF